MELLPLWGRIGRHGAQMNQIYMRRKEGELGSEVEVKVAFPNFWGATPARTGRHPPAALLSSVRFGRGHVTDALMRSRCPTSRLHLGFFSTGPDNSDLNFCYHS